MQHYPPLLRLEQVQERIGQAEEELAEFRNESQLLHGERSEKFRELKNRDAHMVGSSFAVPNQLSTLNAQHPGALLRRLSGKQEGARGEHFKAFCRNRKAAPTHLYQLSPHRQYGRRGG